PRKPTAPRTAVKAGTGEGSSVVRPQERARSSLAAPDKRAALRPGPKSLMKTSDLAARGAPQMTLRTNGGARRTPVRRTGRDQAAKIEERVAAASEELASGIGEAASAAEELRRGGGLANSAR